MAHGELKEAKEALSKLPEAYQIVMNDLLKSMIKASSLIEAMNLFNEFSKKYTLIPEVIHCCGVIVYQNFNDQNSWRQIFRKGFLHLFNEKWRWINTASSKDNLLNLSIKTTFLPFLEHFDSMTSKVNYSLSYSKNIFLPLDRLIPMYWQYKIYNMSPMPPESYFSKLETSEKLCEAILASENDEEKWVENLKKAGSRRLIFQNFECRIGRQPWNKKVWSLYLQFLREEKEMDTVLLHTYSRYCRLFFEDKAMFKEYKAEVNRCQKLSENIAEWKEDIEEIKNSFYPSKKRFIWKWLKNIDLKALRLRNRRDVNDNPDTEPVLKEEKNNNCFLSTEFYDTEYCLIPISRKNPLSRYSNTVTTRSMVNQNFGIPSPYIRYIIEYSRDYVLQKLFLSCKYFFHFNPTPICYKLDVAENYDGEQYFKNTFFISTEAFLTTKSLPDFHHTRVLSLQGVPSMPPSTILQAIRAKLPLITELHLFRQQIRLNDFKLLTSQVEFFSMNNRSVIYDGIDKMAVHSIIDEMPKLKDAIFNHEIGLFDPFDPFYEYSEPTKFLNTCIMLSVRQQGYDFDVNSFCNFIKKNCTSTTFVKLDFHEKFTYFFPKLDDQRCEELVAALSEVDWESRHRQPHMKLTINRKDYYFS